MCFVQVEYQIVGDNRISRGKESDQTADKVALCGGEALIEVGDVGEEVHFLHRPGVLDGIPVLLIENGIRHRPESEIESGIENHKIAPILNMYLLTGFAAPRIFQRARHIVHRIAGRLIDWSFRDLGGGT